MSDAIELMQHALGIGERCRIPYRNYFLAGDGHTDNEEWKKLVADGCATSRPAPDFVGGGTIYHVTDKGEAKAISALPEPKKRTRYDDYRHSEVCESFGEWLGIELPVYESREAGRYKWEYRMVRRSRAYWDTYCDVRGEWKPTKKAAKASYKEALRKSKEASQ
ncbi:hypothetical protein DUU50_12070 [Salmonella enterica subsp. enterica serovar Corvallis]|uniref:hypothetical protein n=1 Tax=Salmonella enterica TaxID=28901 RepID=UPI000FADB930|nr:hypothetical protein [Salmonella enterica]EAA6139654.1 hypothetical protein [Salmonella enterica subsp. enterica serovar Corvallis]EED7523246.1 hypothetical protein [Salmonella enterica subsp. enterica serovar Blockley]EEN8238286.1 hypothetical protein [Salmonella enterica subsp. enterica serovar Newport]EAA6790989.1 hypothetical protein [Salmonella enterica subsp. enterica serovar Corvallis]EAA6822079.1 hypothetical protein [Salmonella enterica subsp. enterica serovar Corvallis]